MYNDAHQEEIRMNDIGKKMYERRKELGLTLEEVGEAVGVGKSTVRKWENGMIKNMGRDKIAALSKVLQMSPVEFVPVDGNPDEYYQRELNDRLDKLKTVEARLLAKGVDSMPKEKREQALAIMKTIFVQYADFFNKENDDDDT